MKRISPVDEEAEVPFMGKRSDVISLGLTCNPTGELEREIDGSLIQFVSSPIASSATGTTNKYRSTGDLLANRIKVEEPRSKRVALGHQVERNNRDR